MSSDEENNAKYITLEGVIEQCGAFSRYQFFHTFLLLFFPIAAGICNFYFIFAAAEPPYACQLPNPIDTEFVFEASPTQCTYVKRDIDNTTVGIYPCTSWRYGRHAFGHTFTEEANLVCDRSFQRSFLAAALQMGAMFIFFTGQITDLVGRRRTMHLLIALLLITTSVTQTIIQFMPISINQKYGIQVSRLHSRHTESSQWLSRALRMFSRNIFKIQIISDQFDSLRFRLDSFSC